MVTLNRLLRNDLAMIHLLQPGWCQTWSETQKTGFLMAWVILFFCKKSCATTLCPKPDDNWPCIVHLSTEVILDYTTCDRVVKTASIKIPVTGWLRLLVLRYL